MSGYLLSSQGDRMAMAASIEGRFPFLDHRVIEFANRLPPRFKLRGLHEKVPAQARDARACRLDRAQRTKQPYRAPDSASFFDAGQPVPTGSAELLSAAQPRRRRPTSTPRRSASWSRNAAAGRAIGFGDNMAFVGMLSTMLVHAMFIRGTPAPLAL